MSAIKPLLLLAVLLRGGALVIGQVQTYTDRNTFLVDLAAMGVALTWENVSADTMLPSTERVRGITFSYKIGEEVMQVTEAFSQTTEGGRHSLGLRDSDVSFLSGDRFTMTFDIASSFLGLYVIGSPGDVRGGDLTLHFGGGEICNASDPEKVLADGGEAYFLGIIVSGASAGFTEAILESHDPKGCGLFVFNVDDIIHHGCAANLDEYGSVSLSDFRRFSQYWLASDCGFCGGADFTGDHQVLLNDLIVFVSDWLCGM